MSKIYVITGATSGIGKAVLEKLAVDNIVFAGYRDEKKVKELTDLSSNVRPLYVDYALPKTVCSAVEYIRNNCEKVDTLINIAGCVVAGPIEMISVDEIRRQFNVNVFGHIEMMQGLAPILNDGKIINVSSMSSYGIFPFISPYCASKKSLDMFFNSFLVENKRNIKVVSIKPGVIATPLWNKSVKENTELLVNCADYQKEMDYVARNAQKNESKGLTVERVVNVILKADKAKNPKLTYTIGKDACFARIVAKLPQVMINKLVKLGISLRMK